MRQKRSPWRCSSALSRDSGLFNEDEFKVFVLRYWVVRRTYLMIEIGFYEEIRTQPRNPGLSVVRARLLGQHAPAESLLPLGTGAISDRRDLCG